MSNWAKATDVEETALTDEMFFIWSQMEALWVSFAVAQLKSGASSQPTVNNLVSYTEEVFYLFFINFINLFFINYHEDAASWYFSNYSLRENKIE